MTEIFRECIKSYPKRPRLDPAEWPFRRDELEDRVDYWMLLLRRLAAAPAKRLHHHPRQLLHNGRKP